jgi:CheY-like chemotaxis protein
MSIFEEKLILLVEDNPDDEALTLCALKKNHIVNEVVVAHDGAEALDFLFGTGSYQGRDTSVMPVYLSRLEVAQNRRPGSAAPPAR